MKCQNCGDPALIHYMKGSVSFSVCLNCYVPHDAVPNLQSDMVTLLQTLRPYEVLAEQDGPIIRDCYESRAILGKILKLLYMQELNFFTEDFHPEGGFRIYSLYQSFPAVTWNRLTGFHLVPAGASEIKSSAV